MEILYGARLASLFKMSVCSAN